MAISQTRSRRKTRLPLGRKRSIYLSDTDRSLAKRAGYYKLEVKGQRGFLFFLAVVFRV